VRRYNVLSKRPMPVYGDAPTLGALRRTFGYVFESGAPKGGGVPDLRLWTIGGRFSIGRQEVVPVPLKHGRWTILGFRFGRFAYLTDCNGIPESSFPLLTDLEAVVLDALRRRPHPTHFTIDEAVVVAGKIGATRTFFTHIAHDLGHAETCASLPAGMALAHDGLVLDIP
jgi:phosphoribosyl 1,2-cyclic phosphate phosphodiesterase